MPVIPNEKNPDWLNMQLERLRAEVDALAKERDDVKLALSVARPLVDFDKLRSEHGALTEQLAKCKQENAFLARSLQVSADSLSKVTVLATRRKQALGSLTKLAGTILETVAPLAND